MEFPQQPFRGLHGSLNEEPKKEEKKKEEKKKEEPLSKAAPKSIEQKRMEVAKKHAPKQPAPTAEDPWWKEKRPVISLPPGKDMAGDLEKSIEWAADKFKWDPRTSDAVSEAASSLANEMAGINVDKLKLLKTTQSHRDGVPDRIYFKDEDGYEWEVVREEDGWDWHAVEDS